MFIAIRYLLCVSAAGYARGILHRSVGFSFFMIRDLPMTVLVQKSISTSQSFTMLAIPLFILAGNLMNSCGLTKRPDALCPTPAPAICTATSVRSPA